MGFWIWRSWASWEQGRVLYWTAQVYTKSGLDLQASLSGEGTFLGNQACPALRISILSSLNREKGP